MRSFHDGASDGLEALEALDPDHIHSFADLLHAMRRTAFGGRRLGEAFEILKTMVNDPDCFVVLTLSGAMTIAKMGKIICTMIDRNMIQAVVSTGALIAHGMSEAVGQTHYKYQPSLMNDVELYEKGYNRVYDTLEMELNLNHVEAVARKTLSRLETKEALSSELLTRELGRTLADDFPGPGILKSAFLKKVPVYIPAFTDSELGLDVSIWAMGQQLTPEAKANLQQGKPSQIWESLRTKFPLFNPFHDLNSYTSQLLKAKRLGIFTIGGGVPRNWAQQTPPYIEILNLRLNSKLSPPRFQYGVRICPEPDYWGGLSGCTYQEGISWGKFIPPKEGGRFAEVLSDATIVWPLLVMGLLDSQASPPPAA